LINIRNLLGDKAFRERFRPGNSDDKESIVLSSAFDFLLGEMDIIIKNGFNRRIINDEENITLLQLSLLYLQVVSDMGKFFGRSFLTPTSSTNEKFEWIRNSNVHRSKTLNPKDYFNTVLFIYKSISIITKESDMVAGWLKRNSLSVVKYASWALECVFNFKDAEEKISLDEHDINLLFELVI
jgi:hypothetical protein